LKAASDLRGFRLVISTAHGINAVVVLAAFLDETAADVLADMTFLAFHHPGNNRDLAQRSRTQRSAQSLADLPGTSWYRCDLPQITPT
jgi:hypothetical protein